LPRLAPARASRYDRGVTSLAAAPLRRIAARGRPLEDPRCTGCAHLGLLRAIRRAGLVVRGGLGCEPPVDAARGTPAGRVARLAGAAEALENAESLVAESRAVALLAIADRFPERTGAVTRALASAGARVLGVPLDATPSETERLVREALSRAPTALVALAACARGAPRRPTLAIDPARCNRCGSCLSIGCVALADLGGDVIEIDGASCTGCGQCAPLCRAGALRRP
jgi:NAD-dependent dihydropyrimidine dehydrogenase PreA subunit